MKTNARSVRVAVKLRRETDDEATNVEDAAGPVVTADAGSATTRSEPAQPETVLRSVGREPVHEPVSDTDSAPAQQTTDVAAVTNSGNSVGEAAETDQNDVRTDACASSGERGSETKRSASETCQNQKTYCHGLIDPQCDSDVALVFEEFVRRSDVFVCKCDMIFTDDLACRLHSQSHTHDNIFQCGQCREVFESTLKLHLHLQNTACVPVS